MGSHAAVTVTAWIVEHPMCRQCLAEKTSLPADTINAALDIVQRSVYLHEVDGARCRSCHNVGTVVVVSRPR